MAREKVYWERFEDECRIPGEFSEQDLTRYGYRDPGRVAEINQELAAMDADRAFIPVRSGK